MMQKTQVILISALLATAAMAQNGDREGEPQPMLFPEHLIPDAPVLSPQEALDSFTVKPGFRVELVADDALLNTPVAMEFDPDGRIWVVEMVGYMPNADGIGEDKPVGSIAVLEDTDGDGRMDKRTTFLDQLVMPRAICILQDGVLIAEMPNLWLAKDTDGDLVCDEKTAIVTDYVQGDINNPEHNANGLMWGLDNWIYSANYTRRIRQIDGEWVQSPTIFRGQWGLSQDNWGRQVYDTNSDQLRIDMIPAEYLSRNPHLRSGSGVNVDPVGRQDVFPIRVNPGINRGYQENMLRDGYLARFTGACGPVVYRGDNFPEEFQGNAFVAEPTGNLIKRNILVEEDGVVTGRFAYEDSEFLASTDERFRPVNLYNGPDGALYVVDMYRGLIQHRIYLTTYLRQQVEKRGLAAPTDLGRIYRVVYEDKPLNAAPRLSQMAPVDLVDQLRSPNGWTRDTAQRLLVEHNDSSAALPLKLLATSNSAVSARVHALWALEGMGGIDESTLAAALQDDSVKVRVAALRIADTQSELRSELGDEVVGLVEDASDGELIWQLALSLGNYPADLADAPLAKLAIAHAGEERIVDAVVSGLAGRELEFIETVLAAAPTEADVSGLLGTLAGAVFREAEPERIDRFFGVVADAAVNRADQAVALLDGASSIMPRGRRGRPGPRVRAIELAAEPTGHTRLATSDNDTITEAVARLEPLVSWPDKGGDGAEAVRPLTAAEQQLFEQGKELYTISCGACHQPHGRGQEGLAPPLAGSDWVLGSDERLIRIVLHGLMGPITVNDKEWDLIMPGLAVFDDEQLAAILTYIRREWDNTGDPIQAAQVAAIREQHGDRIDLWTEEELLKIE